MKGQSLGMGGQSVKRSFCHFLGSWFQKQNAAWEDTGNECGAGFYFSLSIYLDVMN